MVSIDRFEDRYFDWLCHFIDMDNKVSNYSNLLRYLDDTPFDFDIALDENRSVDGIELRYKFGKEIGCPRAAIDEIFCYYDCSILEMMVALSIKIEKDIMENGITDRTPIWFWEMIANLGLLDFTNDRFDKTTEKELNSIIDIFLYRKYTKYGKGSLFHIPYDFLSQKHADMRTIDIWTQAAWNVAENHFAD